jgi:hypothetical protein
MQFHNTLTYKGKEWRYSFTNPEPLLSRRTEQRLLIYMLDMFHEGDQNLMINEEDYSARISKAGFTSIGFLSGVEYVATIETEKGKSNIGVLILDQIKEPSMN